MLPVRKINRLAQYDYRQDNLYFVTCCVHNHVCCLGHIAENTMHLNAHGTIVQNQWFWLTEQYPYVRLHAFVIMPNHIHGILEINRYAAVGSMTGVENGIDTKDGMQTNAKPSLLEMGGTIQIKSLGSLIGAFKTTTSKAIHNAGFTGFKWQRSYWDHIIRDDAAYNTISTYIHNNPASWQQDKFFKL